MSFALLYFAPSDPVERLLTADGSAVNPEIIAKERARLGLDRPFIEQYFDWLKNLLKGDMGKSYDGGVPVAEKLSKALGYTIKLAALSTLLAVIFAVPLGIYSAVRQNRLSDYIIRIISFVGNSLPNFVLCIFLMYLFCIRRKIFPIVAKNTWQGILLPTLALAIPLASRLTRQIRAEILDQLKKEYISGAEVRGVKACYILFKNALRNALPGILTVAGLAIGTLLGGSVVVETIFRWPGIGKLVMDSITLRDYPVIQGFVIITAMIYVAINLIVDISQKLLDPRTRNN